MDPIRPIQPDAFPPVQPVERRKWKDEEERERERERRRRRERREPIGPSGEDDDEQRPRVDVRA